MKIRTIITSLALLVVASTASAQSTVTGTLSSGASGTSTLSGTVGTSSGSTLTGTVTGGGTTGGGGGSSGGGGGGGGGGGSGTNTVDICPNIAGVQATLAGYVLQNGNCVLAGVGGGGDTTGGGSVLGTSTETPGVPNTGAGGETAGTLLLLAASAALMGLAGRYLIKSKNA